MKLISQECQAPDAVAGWQWSASSVNPLKLAYGVYRACYALGGFGLYAYAPVTEVVPNATSSHPWTVVTPRGSVNAAKVVHATNAYSKLLLPELDGLVQPFRGMSYMAMQFAVSDLASWRSKARPRPQQGIQASSADHVSPPGAAPLLQRVGRVHKGLD